MMPMIKLGKFTLQTPTHTLFIVWKLFSSFFFHSAEILGWFDVLRVMSIHLMFLLISFFLSFFSSLVQLNEDRKKIASTLLYGLRLSKSPNGFQNNRMTMVFVNMNITLKISFRNSQPNTMSSSLHESTGSSIHQIDDNQRNGVVSVERNKWKWVVMKFWL